jgi:ribosomal protein L18E
MYLQGLPGFTSSTVAAVQTALVNYLNSLAIGEEVTYSALWSVALSVTPNISQPEFSIKSVSLGTTADGLFTVVPGSVPGTGYAVNDVLTVAVGTSGTVTVTSVDGGGAITGIAAKVTTPGTGYALATGSAVTGGTGSGGHVNITAVQPTAATDLSLLFYQAAQGVSAHVVVAAV